MWKDFFYFSNRERQGLLLLIVFIAGIFLGKWLFTPPPLPPIEALEAVATNSILSSNRNAEITTSYPSEKQQSQSAYSTKKEYREKKNYEKEETRTYYQQENMEKEVRKSNDFIPQEKLQAGVTIELNAADTTQLKMIPGIGSSYANRIVGYRKLLGGYHSLNQLQEVHGMYEELYDKMISFLTINPALINKIAVNNSSVEKLKSHPYINFYQAKAIVEIRKKNGKLTGISELQLLEEFTEKDWEKITPYLDFNSESDK